MAAGNVARFSWVPGRMIINPTAAFATGTYPYGGTEVGRVIGYAVQPYVGEPFKVACEGLGTHSDILEPSQGAIVGFMARGWDDDAVTWFVSWGYAAGSVTRHAVFTEPGTHVPGRSALGRVMKVAFIPDDTLNQPGIIVYAGVPYWTEGAEVMWRRSEELLLPITLHCSRNSSGNDYQVGRIEDLSLT